MNNAFGQWLRVRVGTSAGLRAVMRVRDIPHRHCRVFGTDRGPDLHRSAADGGSGKPSTGSPKERGQARLRAADRLRMNRGTRVVSPSIRAWMSSRSLVNSLGGTSR